MHLVLPFYVACHCTREYETAPAFLSSVKRGLFHYSDFLLLLPSITRNGYFLRLRGWVLACLLARGERIEPKRNSQRGGNLYR